MPLSCVLDDDEGPAPVPELGGVGWEESCRRAGRTCRTAGRSSRVGAALNMVLDGEERSTEHPR